MFILDANVISQSDFSVKMNRQTKQEIDRWTKEPTQNTFTDFRGKYKMAYK